MKHFLSFVEDNTIRFVMEEQNLIAEGRKDEANLMRIRQNVYGIGKSMYEVAIQLSSNDVKGEVQKRLNSILITWEENYKKATEHQDAEKIVVEETKLETLCNILNWLDTAK